MEVSNIAPPKVKQSPEDVVQITIDLGHGRFEMQDAFELRQHAIEVGKASEQIWNGISDKHREVLTEIFKRALEVMHQNVDRYLPNIITGEAGDLVNINVKVLLSKIEEKVEILKSTSEIQRAETKRQMMADVMEQVKPLDDEEFIDHIIASLGHGIPIPNDAVERALRSLGVDMSELD